MTPEQGEITPAVSEKSPDREAKTERYFGCASLLAILTALGLVYWAGKTWLETIFPDPGVGSFSLALDLGRPLAYLLVVGFPGLLAIWLLKMPRFELWRGVGLAMAVSTLFAVPLGVLQAVNNQMPYPGLPDWLRPLVMLLIGLGLLWLFRGLYRGRPKAEVLWLGAAMGALTALSYTLAGALGTPGEASLALLDALSLALGGVILIATAWMKLIKNRRPSTKELIILLGLFLLFFGALIFESGQKWGLFSSVFVGGVIVCFIIAGFMNKDATVLLKLVPFIVFILFLNQFQSI